MKIKSLHLSPPKEPDRAPKTQYDPNPKNSPIRSKRDLKGQFSDLVCLAV